MPRTTKKQKEILARFKLMQKIYRENPKRDVASVIAEVMELPEAQRKWEEFLS